MADAKMTCEHNRFFFQCNVAKIKDSGRFMAEITAKCEECNKPFQFLGLQPGLDMDGARVSVDGLELNIAICPQGVKPSPLQNMMRGYDISLGKSGKNQ